MLVPENQRPSDLAYYQALDAYWDRSPGTNLEKLQAFTKYVPMGEFAKFLAKVEIFKQVLHVHGAIIECGVYQGAGLMTWLNLCALFEPVNHIRKIVGFDTFEGFKGVSDKDARPDADARPEEGDLAAPVFEDLREAIQISDMFRPLGHIQKVELVRGDVRETLPAYVARNPHLTVALLYLDFDLYEPTKLALEVLRERMPKGAVIVFDELYNAHWPGETQAVIETLGLANLRIRRFPFHPQISYAVLD